MTYFESPKLTDWQRQIVLGTILGGSSVVVPKNGRNCFLFMRSKNTKWIKYKAEELKIASSQRPFTYEGAILRWHSVCFPIFNEFREMFYVDGKKTLSMPILDQLRDIGLAIWYGDAGKIKKDEVSLNTSKFGKSGTELVVKYFTEVGIKCDLIQQDSRYRVLMDKEGSKKFLMITLDCLPEFMQG